ncbi:DsrE family protein [Candidatus Sulfurimonas marisnigri]|uniref:DsrE family protein n=1 Tax=Candidatus Sulfurimonas marisnigri TaxID=2740405 RepID=A0A7S7M0H2_9BACT|nr:DsrE family protein [Candidatus Sulfurimonas marisnigri]QOY54857.1 DsrE family protein [Candidatus Sulfurimonas marisnigri]
MKKFIIIVTIFLGLLRADEDIYKLVLDVTTSDIGKFKQSVISGVAKNKAYYEGKFKELEVVAVIHGGAYKFFLKDVASSKYKEDKELIKEQKELAIRVKSLSETYNVKFLICKSGMDKHLIKKEDMYDFVELIPNAMIGLIDTQNNGSAYVPVK